MICTVTTALGGVEKLIKFRNENISNGADHVFVFLDDGDHKKAERINGYDHITAFAADQDYWGGERPENLNLRQTKNANLINQALAELDERVWLFHIDSDESILLDKDHIESIRGFRYVKLEVREAVCKPIKRGVLDIKSKKYNGIFKRLLSHDELCLLACLGEIEKADNGYYFNGHTVGKSGVVASKDIIIGIHGVKKSNGAMPVSYKSGVRSYVLHYDMPDFGTFVEKWNSHIQFAGKAGYKDKRGAMKSAISSINSNTSLTKDEKVNFLGLVYTSMVEDNIPLLSKLNYLTYRSDVAYKNVHRPVKESIVSFVKKKVLDFPK